MALSASLTVYNHTGSTLTFTQVNKVNDDSTWAGIKVGDTLAPDDTSGTSATLAMGNSSVFIAPQGCGCDLEMTIPSLPDTPMGIKLDIPAVGAHSWTWKNQATYYNYATTNPSGNNYTVTITEVNTSTNISGWIMSKTVTITILGGVAETINADGILQEPTQGQFQLYFIPNAYGVVGYHDPISISVSGNTDGSKDLGSGVTLDYTVANWKETSTSLSLNLTASVKGPGISDGTLYNDVLFSGPRPTTKSA